MIIAWYRLGKPGPLILEKATKIPLRLRHESVVAIYTRDPNVKRKLERQLPQFTTTSNPHTFTTVVLRHIEAST